jgi:hypothetical protein
MGDNSFFTAIACSIKSSASLSKSAPSVFLCRGGAAGWSAGRP